MKINNLKLDYYSDFLGEAEIRFYTNPKAFHFEETFKKIQMELQVKLH